MKIQVLSLREILALYPDAESARLYLEARRWPDGVRCPSCGRGERITPRAGGYYRCGACEDFTVRTGTVMGRSKIPLKKWLYAMYFLVTARKGISSMQLAQEIGVAPKSAWFLLQRLREACGPDLDQLHGIVEVDEAYIGGKEHAKPKTQLDAIVDKIFARRVKDAPKKRKSGGRNLARFLGLMSTGTR